MLEATQCLEATLQFSALRSYLALQKLSLFFFFSPWPSLLKESLRKQLHLKRKGVLDTREMGNGVLLSDFFIATLGIKKVATSIK